MKHTVTASDGMTLSQPPSREIMPHDPVTPLAAIPLPLSLSPVASLISALESRFLSDSCLADFRVIYWPHESPHFVVLRKEKLVSWVATSSFVRYRSLYFGYNLRG